MLKCKTLVSSGALLTGVIVLVGVFALPVVPAAQSSAGIVGAITDISGAVLPGVTVSATGPALQVASVVAVTDARGEYRLTPLPPGVYTVTFARRAQSLFGHNAGSAHES